jgi:hypothetical protein
MPKASTSEISVVGWLFLVALLAVAWPLLLLGWFVLRRHHRHLLEQRPGENIGTLARAFDRRAKRFDPWVVRATWDALVPYVTHGDWHVPLRPTDRLEEDLRIDPDDIEFGLIEEVAARSSHTLHNLESYPVSGGLETVGDFVRFITQQPRIIDSSR